MLAGCGGGATPPVESSSPAVPTGSAAATSSGDGAVLVHPTPEAEDSEPGPTSSLDALADDDALAGIRSTNVVERGDGNLTTVPGSQPAAQGSGREIDVAVQVEGGVDVEPARFADFVLTTLNDPRSWTADGYRFARVDDAKSADVIVVLASPMTSADMCRPLVTAGRLSCRSGRRAILTNYRWVNGQEEYGDNRNNYRRYVVNHEVGHFLGHGHKPCPGPGQLAPVMMQQTKGLLGCQPNPWPHPEVATP